MLGISDLNTTVANACKVLSFDFGSQPSNEIEW